MMLAGGLKVSERMQSALDEYRSESDSVGNFFAERVVPAERGKLQTSVLYANMRSW
jgi:phage/plasmid-associated DNA primase